MKSKSKYIFLLILFLGVIYFPLLLTWIIDPVQYYHKSWIIPDKGIKDNEREQIAGRIHHYMNKDPDYDTVIVGASNAQNLEPERVADALHSKKAISLAISGAAPVLQSEVLEFAFNHASFKNVLWVIAPNWREDKDIDPLNGISPSFLLDNNIFNDIKYAYSFKMYKSWFKIIMNSASFKTAISKVPFLKGYLMFEKKWVADFDYVPMWSSLNDIEVYAHADKIMQKNLIDAIPKIKATLAKIKKGEPIVFQKNIVDQQITDKMVSENYWLPKLVSEYSDTRFIFLVPTLSSAFYLTVETPEERSEHFYKSRRLLKLLGKYKNVEIYAQSTFRVLSDLTNYQNLTHPILSVQRNTLKRISKNEMRITHLTIEKYEQELMLGIETVQPEILPVYSNKDRVLSFSGDMLY